ncbi:DNA topoisomerase 4 subunit A [Oscillatoriales cyanobacterium LEGE 11467]|uniref:DNA topoisomerase (ATP-hydrolyzing) n=1 Tax=Zarconia navalis LEGE 11467 TaxID=1828826 RepID=A0A928W0J1_9CYAN|nr:DNA topoisomerase (ATP-hydrolyzing) [Zarconia navalis]MBE9042663.1 DNA topoisomerase 4 subunit A [Zarconia navalis LEGE 11467]
MAKQLNLLAKGQIVSTALHTEMQQSYLEYAMSVIVGRALPDVRDGLKPVHRRILYAMHELGLTPDRPYRKCARVVGDVLGKYHPHGDQAVYDALVRMVQEFSSRYPLLAGHGNFGSVDNDPAAAMRYTETRLSPIGNEALLSEIGEATVDFIGNFDSSQQEPVVLPAQLPILLLNGCSGIAVGMATNIPPHNLGEVVDAAIALVDRPTLDDEKLLQLIPGPDFPTGGEIIGTQGIRDAYRTGRGSITMRGVVGVEQVDTGRTRRSRRSALIVSEFPFQVSKSSWIEKVAALVNQGRLEGISDLRDESDRDGIRVVVELKREAKPKQVLAQLYRQTPLQQNFGAILLAIVDGQPRQLPLREILQQFLDFRERTLTRQYRDELEKTEDRLHLLEGLLMALEALDEIIEILRGAADGTTAKIEFQNRFDFSDRQASAILAMPLRRLTGLERQNLQAEFEELTARRSQLQNLLNDRNELLKALKKELRSFKRKFKSDRLTRIISAEAQTVPAQAISPKKGKPKKGKPDSAQISPALDLSVPEEKVMLEFTHRGYVRRLTPAAWEKQRSKQDPPRGKILDSTEDFSVRVLPVKTGQDLLVLTRDGKAYSTKIADIPPIGKRNSRGEPLVGLLPPSAGADRDTCVEYFVRSDYPNTEQLLLLTAQGRIKRLSLEDLTNMTVRGLTALKLKDDDRLFYGSMTRTGEEVAIATTGGRVLRLTVDEEQLPILGRTAQGYQVMRLRKNEGIVGCATVRPGDDIVLVTKRGYAKRLAVGDLRLSNRGEIGTQALQFATKADTLAGMVPARRDGEVRLLTSRDRFVSLLLDPMRSGNKDSKGKRIADLKSTETIVSLTLCLP